MTSPKQQVEAVLLTLADDGKAAFNTYSDPESNERQRAAAWARTEAYAYASRLIYTECAELLK